MGWRARVDRAREAIARRVAPWISATLDQEEVAARELADAIRPVLAAYRSTSNGHVTEEQVTRAWAAYDELRRLLG